MKAVPYIYALVYKVATLEHFAKSRKKIPSRVFSEAESVQLYSKSDLSKITKKVTNFLNYIYAYNRNH